MPAPVDLAAVLEADLRVEVKRTARRIAMLVFLFGWCVFMAMYSIVTPADTSAWFDTDWFQVVAVTTNVGAAVYAWHVAFYLAKARAEWLEMIERLRRMRELR